jgi:hypothetical protein
MFDSFRAHHLFNDLPTKSPHGSTFDEVLKKARFSAHGLEAYGTPCFSYLIGVAEGLVSKDFMSNSAIIVYRHLGRAV